MVTTARAAWAPPAVRVVDDDSLCSILGIPRACYRRRGGSDCTRVESYVALWKGSDDAFGDTGVNILARESKRKWVY